jgi:hypothetical protein
MRQSSLDRGDSIGSDDRRSNGSFDRNMVKSFNDFRDIKRESLSLPKYGGIKKACVENMHPYLSVSPREQTEVKSPRILEEEEVD